MLRIDTTGALVIAQRGPDDGAVVVRPNITVNPAPVHVDPTPVHVDAPSYVPVLLAAGAALAAQYLAHVFSEMRERRTHFLSDLGRVAVAVETLSSRLSDLADVQIRDHPLDARERAAVAAGVRAIPRRDDLDPHEALRLAEEHLATFKAMALSLRTRVGRHGVYGDVVAELEHAYNQAYGAIAIARRQQGQMDPVTVRKRIRERATRFTSAYRCAVDAAEIAARKGVAARIWRCFKSVPGRTASVVKGWIGRKGDEPSFTWDPSKL